MRRRLLVALFVPIHLLLSGAVALTFMHYFGHHKLAVLMHIIVVAEWDAFLLLVLGGLVVLLPARRVGWARIACAGFPAATLTLQLYLYCLNVISNSFWGRNISSDLVVAFAPTVLSGREPFPVGARGAALFALGTLATTGVLSRLWGRPLYDGLRSWIEDTDRARSRVRRRLLLVVTIPAASVFAATLAWGIQSDWLLWNTEMITSFFRPSVIPFEPTPRRLAVAERDDQLRAAYPRHVPGMRQKHIVLIIVDSLRADHMQVYGYHRETTPFLTELFQSGRMHRVEVALSTCSESYCGIASILSGREFRDISARNFKLHDVLRDQGYQTWFLLAGNHRAWNGLTQFYDASDGTLFDGSQARRYTMNDDRTVLESLRQVPPASPAKPSFFYFHLMSTHYLGVQLQEYRAYTRRDDQVKPDGDPHQSVDLVDNPDRYDEKVKQADGFIRQIFEVLDAKHYLHDALIVVTSDHGEGLGERHKGHGLYLYDEDLRIPMLIYDAPDASYGNLKFATQVDVAPTILDRLGLPIPASWVGQSLLAPTVKRYSFHQTYYHPTRYAVVYRADDAIFKFIATPADSIEELYDVTRDGGETHNLVRDQPALADHLRDKLHTYLAGDP